MKKNQTYNVRELEPDEVNEYKRLTLEYVKRLESIDNEIETLKEDKKALKEEFEEKIDLKTLKQVIQLLKLEAGIVHKDTFDVIKDALKDESQ